MTVSEVVTEAQLTIRTLNKTKGNVYSSEVKDIQLTLTVIPWYIDVITESEVKVVLRFLNFSMDARSEMSHCILQEIAVGLGSSSEHLKHFQFVPRTVYIETTFNVIDVIISNEHSIDLANLYAHFTGNAIGGTQRITMGGVHATVMAGNNIQEMVHHKMQPQLTYWATLHGLNNLRDIQYITYLLIAGGCKAVDICSVIFAKPDLRVRKTMSIALERKMSAKRALMEENCTVIFASEQVLHQFIVHFRSSTPWLSYPEVQLGFAEVAFPNTVQKMGIQTDVISEEVFQQQRQVEDYSSNDYQTEHLELAKTRGNTGSQYLITPKEKCLNAIKQLTESSKEMKTFDYLHTVFDYCADVSVQVLQYEESKKRDHDNMEYGSQPVENISKSEIEGMDVDELSTQQPKWSEGAFKGQGYETRSSSKGKTAKDAAGLDPK